MPVVVRQGLKLREVCQDCREKSSSTGETMTGFQVMLQEEDVPIVDVRDLLKKYRHKTRVEAKKGQDLHAPAYRLPVRQSRSIGSEETEDLHESHKVGVLFDNVGEVPTVLGVLFVQILQPRGDFEDAGWDLALGGHPDVLHDVVVARGADEEGVEDDPLEQADLSLLPEDGEIGEFLGEVDEFAHEEAGGVDEAGEGEVGTALRGVIGGTVEEGGIVGAAQVVEGRPLVLGEETGHSRLEEVRAQRDTLLPKEEHIIDYTGRLSFPYTACKIKTSKPAQSSSISFGRHGSLT